MKSKDSTNSLGGVGKSVCKEDDQIISYILHLVENYKPKKIMHIGAIEEYNGIPLFELLKMQMDTQIYHVDGFCECKGSHGSSLPERLEKIGEEIDFLILNEYYDIPDELQDFIVVYPYLAKNAVVICHDTLARYKGIGREFGSSVLLQNITATKFEFHQDAYPGLIESIRLRSMGNRRIDFASDIVAGFQVNANTSKYIKDIAVALGSPWEYMPKARNLLLYEKAIEKKYDSEFLHLYKQATANARFQFIPAKKLLKELANSLLPSFCCCLIFGKRNRGKHLLYFCQELGISVDGFVVSDGRVSANQYEGLPVCRYSEISSDKRWTLIMNTVRDPAVKSQLVASEYHWIDFSDFAL